MKELEKTRRISIAAVLTILVVLIALLSYKRPQYVYKTNTHAALEKIVTYDYFLQKNQLEGTDLVLLDVRNPYDFDKGHLEGAISMYAPEILSEENADILERLELDGKTFVLYGGTPNEAIAPFLLLYQVGYPNVKILQVGIGYEQNKMIVSEVSTETTPQDIKGFIASSVEKAKVMPKPVPKKAEAPKKVVPVTKKKKKVPEGGC